MLVSTEKCSYQFVLTDCQFVLTDRRLNRENIIIPLSCGHGYVDCLVNATQQFTQWLANET